MKPAFFLACLLTLPLTAQILEHRSSITDSDITEAEVTEQLYVANMQLAAFLSLTQVQQKVEETTFDHKIPEKKEFLEGLKEQLAATENLSTTKDQLQQELCRAYENNIRSEQENLNYLAYHAAQPGVTILPNGLQYDIYLSPKTEENYKARRAHRILARIPGTKAWFPLENTPKDVDTLLYQLPRAAAWHFLLPIELLDGHVYKNLKENDIKSLELVAVRESLPEKIFDDAVSTFDKLAPRRGTSDKVKQELSSCNSRLLGRLCALSILDYLDSSISLTSIPEVIDNLWGNVIIEHDDTQLKTQLNALYHTKNRIQQQLERMQHPHIARTILEMQAKIPGTIQRNDGILYRITKGIQNVPIEKANYIEVEELGSRRHFRIHTRLFSQDDLPPQLHELVKSMPAGVSWEFIIPANLRLRETQEKQSIFSKFEDTQTTPNSYPDLPIRYRIWYKEPSTQNPPNILSPEIF